MKNIANYKSIHRQTWEMRKLAGHQFDHGYGTMITAEHNDGRIIKVTCRHDDSYPGKEAIDAIEKTLDDAFSMGEWR